MSTPCGLTFHCVVCPQASLDHRRLLDRYSHHTAHCAVCKAAVAGLRRRAEATRAASRVLVVLLCASAAMLGQAVAAAVASGATVAGTAAATAATTATGGQVAHAVQLAVEAAVAGPLGPWPAAVAVVVALGLWVCGAVVGQCEKLIKEFHFVDYVHADRK